MQNVNFLEVDLHQLTTFSRSLAGIVGFDFFRRFIIQVDLKKPSSRSITWPTSIAAGGLVEDGVQFRQPCQCRRPFRKGITGVVSLDTGANRHRDVPRAGGRADAQAAVGANHCGRNGRRGRHDRSPNRQASMFEPRGGHRFENLSAVFSLAKVGAFADRYLTGTSAKT